MARLFGVGAGVGAGAWRGAAAAALSVTLAPLAAGQVGWRGMASPGFEAGAAEAAFGTHWAERDGELRYDGAGPWARTAEEFADVELRLEWKIETGASVVVGLRGAEAINLWERPVGSGTVWTGPGDDREVALARGDRPAGQWNELRVWDVGGRVSVWVNGAATAIERELPRPGGRVVAGPIELRPSRSPASFRNVRVRRLEGKAVERPVLRAGDRVAILGDSITEARGYSRLIETYLRACAPQLDAAVLQSGWSGEKAPAAAARAWHDVAWWRPTVVTTLYGMNDGEYTAFRPEIGERYGAAMAELVDGMLGRGVRVVVGTPGVVDAERFGAPVGGEGYTASLGALAEVARGLALSRGVALADVHGWQGSAGRTGKASLGWWYDVAGADGVHPRENGHLVLAQAFLVALGVDGEIGRIEWDTAGGTATASDGHRVVRAGESAVELESTRYPFAMWGDLGSPDGVRSVARFTPFHSRLNRMVLVVTGAPRLARVTWEGVSGEGLSGAGVSRVVSAERLAAGINLAEVFDRFPTDERFLAVDAAVGRKQAHETAVLRGVLAARRGGTLDEAGFAEKMAAAQAAWAELDAAARAAVTPVRHVLRIEAYDDSAGMRPTPAKAGGQPGGQPGGAAR